MEYVIVYIKSTSTKAHSDVMLHNNSEKLQVAHALSVNIMRTYAIFHECWEIMSMHPQIIHNSYMPSPGIYGIHKPKGPGL